MSYVGTVENGVVVLPPEAKLPDGTRVTVEPVARRADPVKDSRPIMEKLLELAGTARGLPPDLAENHDHYLHGTPKRPKA
jgi:hypothetical protein